MERERGKSGAKERKGREREMGESRAKEGRGESGAREGQKWRERGQE